MLVAGLEWRVIVPIGGKHKGGDHGTTPVWSPANQHLFITKEGYPTDRGWAKGYILRHALPKSGLASIRRTADGKHYSLMVATSLSNSTVHASTSLARLLHDAPAIIARHYLVNMR